MDTHNDLHSRRQATVKRFYQKHKTKLKKWREEHKDEKRQYDEQYRKDNAARISERRKLELQTLKKEVFQAYGGKCSCCGEPQIDFLAIDHKDGGGTQARKKNSLWGRRMYFWLKKNNYPSGFQVLCHNCNWSVHLHGGTCIHKL